LNAQIEQITVVVKYDRRHGRKDKQSWTEKLGDTSCGATDGFRHKARRRQGRTGKKDFA
jgi:hypothetical protein